MTDHLRGLLQPVEVRDAQGKLLGVYTPHVTPEELALYEKARGLFDMDEVERIAREEAGKGVPLAEVWKRIHERGGQA